MREVFQAVEEDEDLFHIQDNPNPQCPVGRNIQQVLGKRLALVKDNMLADFAQMTLADLLADIDSAEQEHNK